MKGTPLSAKINIIIGASSPRLCLGRAQKHAGISLMRVDEAFQPEQTDIQRNVSTSPANASSSGFDG
jgi:hypothetical protein